jgi:tyrosyl-tRNA synthetase
VAMDQFNSELLRSLGARGYIHQLTDPVALDAAAGGAVLSAYIGFDATADSLHIGNLVQLMMLRRLQQAGHRPIVLMGGGTSQVGDPSGRDTTRQLLTLEQIGENISRIRQTFQNFLRFDDSPTGALVVDNNEWLANLQYIPFLREIGRHFSINRMLTMDSVKLRLEREQPLTFLEFNYMVMQGYDFMQLHQRYGCTLQLGGSDQWGNIIQGVELARRATDAHLFGLTSALITTSSGAKMGKTASGAVWLNPERRSPYDYWQFWRNTEDGDVGRFLRLFTDVPLAEIERLESLPGAEINVAKHVLATEATRLCHGAAAAAEASATAAQAFSGAVAQGLPTFLLPTEGHASLLDVLLGLGLCATKNEARRLISQGGVRVNDQAVSSPLARVAESDLGADGSARVAVGKKRHGLIRRA